MTCIFAPQAGSRGEERGERGRVRRSHTEVAPRDSDGGRGGVARRHTAHDLRSERDRGDASRSHRAGSRRELRPPRDEDRYFALEED